MNPILLNLIGIFANKKKIIGWIGAVILAVAAAAMGMQTQDFKDAICEGPVIDQPTKAPEPTP